MVTVERDSRPIRIDEIELIEAAGTRIVFRVRCSKGTYIRVLVEDIARSVGTVAHTASLHREGVGDFLAKDMLDLSALEADAVDGALVLQKRLMPPDTALTGLPAVTVSADDGQRFSVGQALDGHDSELSGLVRVYDDEPRFLGVGEVSAAGTIVPKRVFLAPEKKP